MMQCEKCKRYFFGKECGCEPYHILYEEYHGDEPEIFYGFSHEDAFEKFCVNYNDEFEVNEDLFETPVSVKNKSGEEKLLLCYTEPDILYHISEEKP